MVEIKLADLKRANEVLRSAYQIALRHGKILIGQLLLR